METNTIKLKLKDRLKDKFNSSVLEYVDTLRSYPISIGSVFIAAIIWTFIYDSTYENDIFLNLARFTCFLGIFAAGSLFTEELLKAQFIKEKCQSVDEQNRLMYVLLGVFAVIDALMVYILSNDASMFNLTQEEFDTVRTLLLRFLLCYIIVLIVIAIYMMYKRQQVPFEKYCIDVLGTFAKSSLVYLLFAIGIAVIIGISNTLLFDSDNFNLLIRLEIFLAGGIYVPAVVIVFSQSREEIGRFARGVSEFVLLPILLASFVIIYLYILKLIITIDIPSNEVFPILSWLFMCGLPIWTMAGNFTEHIMGKIARVLPYAFIPFIILQMFCLGVRLQAYGLTKTRYLGIVLIILEIIYIALYSYKQQSIVEYIIPIALVFLIFCWLIPGTNVYSVVTRFQSQRLEKILAKGENNLTIDEKRQARESFLTIRDCDCEGDTYIESHFTEEQADIFTSWSYLDGEHQDFVWHYHSSYQDMEELNIQGMRRIIKISAGHDSNSDNPCDATRTPIRKYSFGNSETIYTFDCTPIMEDMLNQEYENDYLKDNNMFKIGGGKYLYITHINFSERRGEYKDISISGYLIE